MSAPQPPVPFAPHEVEALLREAFADRAAEITDATLVRNYSVPPPSELPARRPGWMAPLAAAAAVVAIGLAVGTGVFGGLGSAQQTAPAATTAATTVGIPSPSASVGSNATTGTASASAAIGGTPVAAAVTPRELAADQIPWSAVGVGWSLSALSLDVSATSAQVYLLAPGGTRYPIAILTGTPKIVAVTSNARRALVLSQGSGQMPSVSELDVTTGKTRTLDMSLTVADVAVGYGDSLGSSVLVASYLDTPAGTATTVARWRLDGTRVGQVAQVAGRAVVLPSPDGSRLLVGSQGRLAYYSLDLSRLSSVAQPPGMAWCQPVRWFDEVRALIDCRPDADAPYAVQFTVDLAGTTTQVTPAVTQPAGPAPQVVGSVSGQWQAWPRPDGSILTTRGTGCAVGEYAADTTPMTGATTAIGRVSASSDQGQALVVAVVGRTAYAMVGCSEGLHSVALLSTETMTPVVVLGRPVQSAGDIVGLRVAQETPLAIGFLTYR